MPQIEPIDAFEAAEGWLRASAFGEAERVFEGLIGREPKDWRGYHGKARAVQGQGRYTRAYGVCRSGLEECPDSAPLLELQEEVRLQYQASKSKPRQQQPEPGKLTKDQAREALDAAIEIFDKPENRSRLKSAIEECGPKLADPLARQMQMTTTLLPLAQGLLAPELRKFGFDSTNFLDGMMQVQFHSLGDPEMEPKAKRITDFIMQL